MREIEFRGKRRRNGKWVYGFYIEDDTHSAFIQSTDYVPWKELYAVVPETLGQYTGLKDKNGVKIFEGDIVTFPKCGSERFFVEFYGGAFYASAMNGVGKKDRSDVPSIAAYWWRDCGNGVPTIVGNIHDNPELVNRE